jgi:hypothetical protein
MAQGGKRSVATCGGVSIGTLFCMGTITLLKYFGIVGFPTISLPSITWGTVEGVGAVLAVLFVLLFLFGIVLGIRQKPKDKPR